MDMPFDWHSGLNARIMPTTDAILMDVARYQVRLFSILSAEANETIVVRAAQLSEIMAHLRNPVNFPCPIPPPTCHPMKLWEAWNSFTADDRTMWTVLWEGVNLQLSVYKNWNAVVSANMVKAKDELLEMLSRSSAKCPGAMN